MVIRHVETDNSSTQIYFAIMNQRIYFIHVQLFTSFFFHILCKYGFSPVEFINATVPLAMQLPISTQDSSTVEPELIMSYDKGNILCNSSSYVVTHILIAVAPASQLCFVLWLSSFFAHVLHCAVSSIIHNAVYKPKLSVFQYFISFKRSQINFSW